MDSRITDMYNLVSNILPKLPTSDDDFTTLREEFREKDITGESEECFNGVVKMVQAMQDFKAEYEYYKRKTIVGNLSFNEEIGRFYIDAGDNSTDSLTCGQPIEIFWADRDYERECWYFGRIEGRNYKEAETAGSYVNEYYFCCAHAGNPALEEGMRVRIRK